MEWWEFFLVMIIVMPIVVLWLGCIIDAIARPDISGWAKGAWVLFIIFLPLFGSLIYIVVRPAIGRGSAFDTGWDVQPARESSAEQFSERPQSFGL